MTLSAAVRFGIPNSDEKRAELPLSTCDIGDFFHGQPAFPDFFTRFYIW
jgi:hypothetical protein